MTRKSKSPKGLLEAGGADLPYSHAVRRARDLACARGAPVTFGRYFAGPHEPALVTYTYFFFGSAPRTVYGRKKAESVKIKPERCGGGS